MWFNNIDTKTLIIRSRSSQVVLCKRRLLHLTFWVAPYSLLLWDLFNHTLDFLEDSVVVLRDALVLDEMFGAPFHPDIDVFIIIFNVELTSILHANLNLIDLHVPN